MTNLSGIDVEPFREETNRNVEVLPAALVREAAKLLRFGIGKPLLARMIVAARDNGTTVERELLASGSIHENTYYEMVAEELDLPFVNEPESGLVQDLPGIDSQLLDPKTVRIHHPSRPPLTAIVPRIEHLERLKSLLLRMPSLRRYIAITTATGLRRSVWKVGAARRVAATTQAERPKTLLGIPENKGPW